MPCDGGFGRHTGKPNVDSLLLEYPGIWIASRWGRTVVELAC